MTAEIGILNRNGVALAADSAVTISSSGKNKIFNTANKLFSLSKWHPIGIMIYSTASHMGVPWETIIKIYRVKLGNTKKNTTLEYAEDFINFVKTNDKFITPEAEKAFVERKFMAHFNHIINNTNITINETYKTMTPSDNDVANILHDQTMRYSHSLSEFSDLEGFDNDFRSEFLEKYSKTITDVINSIIKIEIRKDTIQELLIIAANIFSKNTFIIDSGVVIAGYGEEEIFPSLFQYNVEGYICGRLRYKMNNKSIIAAENSEEKTTASITPFAQKEMVYTFMEGIDPSLRRSYEKLIRNAFEELPRLIKHNLEISNSKTKLTEEDLDIVSSICKGINEIILKEISKYQYEKFVDPIVGIVSLLPKEELVALAEALINLTSIKRKMSENIETVGGPIDVAIISKGDGFVWIKRKHYFDPDLNLGFLKKYLRGENDV